jgi:hypothetical protein
MRRYWCGPLQINTFTDDPVLRDKVEETFNLYNVRWNNSDLTIDLELHRTNKRGVKLEGNFIETNRMWVDSTRSGLRVFFEAGGNGEYVSERNSWEVHITDPNNRGLVDIEDLAGLVLTTGWRKLKWVPMHAGAITAKDKCFILCAESGGGKSTLTAAMLHLSWKSLGDDKLLLRIGNQGQPELTALMHNFNLHPQTSLWFPELGDMEKLPEYSVWTPKRRVSIESIWPGQSQNHAVPTHIIQIMRNDRLDGFHLENKERIETLPLLLHQTVIPKEHKTASNILSTLAGVSSQLYALTLEVGNDVYSDQTKLKALEAELLNFTDRQSQ